VREALTHPLTYTERGGNEELWHYRVSKQKGEGTVIGWGTRGTDSKRGGQKAVPDMYKGLHAWTFQRQRLLGTQEKEAILNIEKRNFF